MKKRLGILAGMGPRSTAPFLELVYDQCQKQYDAKNDIDYPEIFVLSWPTPFYIDRPIDHTLLKNSIIDGLRELDKCNVDVIAIPCNIAHLFFSDYQKVTNTKILNIVEVTMEKIPDHARRVTVLATQATMKSGIFQRGIGDKKKEYFFDGSWQVQVNDLIKDIKARMDPQIIIEKYKALEEKMGHEDIDTVIFGCTDLSVLAGRKHGLGIIDSSEALAEKLVEEYRL